MNLFKQMIPQTTPDMNWCNTELDYVKPNCMFEVSKDEGIKEAISWRNTQPSLKEVHQRKGVKYNF